LDRKNRRNSRPSSDNKTGDEEHYHRSDNTLEGGHTERIEGDRYNNEEESRKVSNQRRIRKKKIELQGEFKKLKPLNISWGI